MTTAPSSTSPTSGRRCNGCTMRWRRPAPGSSKPPINPASVGYRHRSIVTIGLEDLLAKAGLAETADGSQLTSDQLLRIADEADIWPTIIDRNGVPLALGRTRRLASPGQTMALIARDAGCSFPGCTHPPQWCDRHHILDWILGGPTDLDNLTLLCRYHHTHFLQKGWTCRINADGLPEWIPPRWIDQDQQPHINARIQRINTQRQLDRRRPTTNTRSGMRSFDQLVPSQPLSSLVDSAECSAAAAVDPAMIGTAPLEAAGPEGAARLARGLAASSDGSRAGVRCSSSRSMHLTTSHPGQHLLVQRRRTPRSMLVLNEDVSATRLGDVRPRPAK